MDSFGYFFGKFVLLVVLFFNVVYQHDVAKNLIEQQQKRCNTIGTNSMISSRTPVNLQFSPYGSQIGLNTAMTVTDVTQFSGHNPYRNDPLLRHNSLITAYSLAHSPEMTAYLDTSYTHDGSLKTVDSIEEDYKFVSHKHRQSTLNDSLTLSNSGEEKDDRSENNAVKSIPAGDCQKADDEIGGSLQCSENSASIVLKETEEALITNPNEYIVFKYPFSEMVTIYVKNKHNRPIMWALKTNAIKRMIAQPTCGTLGKDATVHVRLKIYFDEIKF
ncbi:unnamed protein product [Onchocerca ochengi]|uniref:Major sperm protein n=1 Tax=Onchocerca ochengi TaxID=42157 RepID=A0A182EU94_ONCOC|nr:unnamed protein product [Onchocerca ochengi]